MPAPPQPADPLFDAAACHAQALLWFLREEKGMMEVKKRKVHSAEFKAMVGIDAVRGAKTINEIAQIHGVHPVMVSQWKHEILARAGTLFECKRGPKAPAAPAGQDRLWSQIERLQVELDVLKKKSRL